VKGQRLFIRSALPTDAEAIAEFARRELGSDPRLAAESLIARLVGDLVGWVAYRASGSALEIEAIAVTESLRRKHIGLALIGELAARARAEGNSVLLVRDVETATLFFQKAGFVRRGELLERLIQDQSERV
jgi:N-acetylglutamate synthase-like GNAT family acetyltransferase